MVNNVLMAAMLLLSLAPFLLQEPRNEPKEPAVQAVSFPVAPSLPVASAVEQKRADPIKPTAPPPASATGPYTEPQDVGVPPQIIYIVNNAMPESTSAPKPEHSQVGETTQGWPVYMGTGLYAVEPGTGDQWSVRKNPNGTLVATRVTLKAR